MTLIVLTTLAVLSTLMTLLCYSRGSRERPGAAKMGYGLYTFLFGLFTLLLIGSASLISQYGERFSQ